MQFAPIRVVHKYAITQSIHAPRLSLQETLSHELSHALYARTGQKDNTHQLLAKYGVGKWQSHALKEILYYQDQERKDTVLGLANFLIIEYLLGNTANVEWATKGLLKYTK
jgi:hypothetical protein